MPDPKPIRTRPVSRQSPRLAYFAVLSLVVHGTLWGLWRSRAATISDAQPREPPSWTLATSSQHPALEAARKALVEAQKARPARSRPKEPLRGTVVDLPPSADNRPPPPSSAHLAEHNARTSKESRSRHSDSRYKNALNEPVDGPQQKKIRPPKSAPAMPASAAARRPQPLAGGVPIERRPQLPPQRAKDRLQLKQSTDAAALHNTEAQAQGSDAPLRLRLDPLPAQDRPQGTGAGDRGGSSGQPLSMAQLVPDIPTLSQLGGGPKNDVGLDVPEGEGTFLNTREFKYASFFNRLKEQISNHWQPLAEYQRRDPSGNIYGVQPRMTVLTIALDHEGALQDLKVAQSSGVDFLDEEGLRAIRAAAPFMHPPKGLLDDAQRIVFNFAFSVDVTGGYHGP